MIAYYKNKSLENLPGEVWRKIPGFHESYRISSVGRIKSMDKTIDVGMGRLQFHKEKILSPGLSSIRKYKTDRYLMLVLSTDKGKKQTTYIHRLVAMAFVKNPHQKPHVNHLDGDTLNNTPSNLQWCTNRENIQHAHRNGLINTPRGENTHKAKLTNKQAIEIAKSSISNLVLAKKFNVDPCTISGIKTGRYWSKVTGLTFKPTRNGYKKPLRMAAH